MSGVRVSGAVNTLGDLEGLAEAARTLGAGANSAVEFIDGTILVDCPA